jgi:hypothetical protein
MTEGASLLRGKRYIHGEPGSPYRRPQQRPQ